MATPLISAAILEKRTMHRVKTMAHIAVQPYFQHDLVAFPDPRDASISTRQWKYLVYTLKIIMKDYTQTGTLNLERAFDYHQSHISIHQEWSATEGLVFAAKPRTSWIRLEC